MLKELLDAYLKFFAKVAQLRQKVKLLELNDCYNDIMRSVQRDSKNKYFQNSGKILNIITQETRGLADNFEHHVSAGAQTLRKITTHLNHLSDQRNARLQEVLQKLLQDYQKRFGKASVNQAFNALDQEKLLELINEIARNVESVQRMHQHVLRKKNWFLVSVEDLNREKYKIDKINDNLAACKNSFSEFQRIVQKLHIQKDNLSEPGQRIDCWPDVEQILIAHIEQFAISAELHQEFYGVYESNRDLGFIKQLDAHDFYNFELQVLYENYNDCVVLKEDLLRKYRKVEESISHKEALASLKNYLLDDSELLGLLEENMRPLLKGYRAVCEGVSSMLMIAMSSLKIARNDLLTAEKQASEIEASLKNYLDVNQNIQKYDGQVSAFAFGDAAAISPDVFAYMKQYYLQSEKVASSLAKLKERADTHPSKQLKLGFFLEVLERSENFTDLQQAIIDALNDEDLIESTTAWGKVLHLESTTETSLREMQVQLQNFMQECASGGELMTGVAKSFKSMQQNFYLGKHYSSLEWLSQFLDKLEPYSSREDVRLLMSELHRINVSMHLSEDAKKVCMATAIHTLHSRLREGIGLAHHQELRVALRECYDNADMLDDLQSSYSHVKQQAYNNPINVMRFIYDRSEYAFIFQWARLRMMVALCETKRNKKMLLKLVDQLMRDSSAGVPFKRNELMHTVRDYYNGIRTSLTGSESLFGKGSRLADTLEQYLTEGQAALFTKKEIAHKMSYRPVIFSCFSG